MASDDEVFIDNSNNLTFVKQKPVANDSPSSSAASAKASKSIKHPTYFDMVQEAILKQAGRTGISKSKICDYVRETYQLEVNNTFVVKAIKSALEKNFIENSTGTGASGSFKITKEHKETLKKVKSVKAKKEKEKEKAAAKILKAETEGAEKTKTTKPKKSKDDMDIPDKKNTKKPPIPKEKEAKAPEMSNGKGTQKVLKEKIKSLKKAKSTGDMKKQIVKSLPELDIEKITTKKSTGRKGKAK